MRWPGWIEKIDGNCPICGSGTGALARACPDCGAPIGLRPAGMMVAGALVVVAAALVLALVAAVRGHQLAAATETGAPVDEQIAAISTTDFSWLTTAMNACDAAAKTSAGALHFLVTPLVSVPRDVAPWREKSINDTGNGILLRSDAALDGLKTGTLRIYPADYGFGIFDSVSDTVLKWRPSAGVVRFSTTAAGAVSTFNVQFRTAHSVNDPDWGGSFTRQDGTCYWVNAIISH
ncbi:MAG TPA: hypothetical protein VG291_18410 [Xanthobacteraceae bacterium]|nr:hypothetical protein [Xanthobacteraceae bacterium]